MKFSLEANQKISINSQNFHPSFPPTDRKKVKKKKLKIMPRFTYFK